MKKLAIALAGALFLVSAPAFACPHEDGANTKTAEKDKKQEQDKAKKPAEKDKAKDTDTAKKKETEKKPDKVSVK